MPDGMILQCANPECKHKVMLLLGTGSVAEDFIKHKDYNMLFNVLMWRESQEIKKLLDQGYTITGLPSIPSYCPDCNLLDSAMVCILSNGEQKIQIYRHCPNCGREIPYFELKPQKGPPFMLDIQVEGRTIRYTCPECKGTEFIEKPMHWS